MMRLLANLAVHLDRVMRHAPRPRAPSSSGGARTCRSSPHQVGLDVRPGTLSWLIARAVTLQYR